MQLLPPPVTDALTSSDVIDEDDMASNSASHVPTQQSVKAFVGAQIASQMGSGAAEAARIDTTESRGTTTYGDLTTPGPAVTVTVPASGQVLVTLTASMDQSSASGFGLMGVTLSGANTVAAADAVSIAKQGTNFETASGTYLLTGLVAGSTTFTAKYRADTAGTADFSRRNLVVTPLPF